MRGPELGVTFEGIRQAAELIRGQVEQTPTLFSRTLSEITGAQVYLKFENRQFTAAFKERGALVKLLSLTPEERDAGVIAMSRGNHAQAIAYHAGRLGIPATIVMPRATPYVKVKYTRAFGAEVELAGDELEETTRRAHEIAAERGLSFVHPYDDEQVISGQGTIALEMLEAVSDLDALVLPIGGGGLISGCAIAAHGVRADIEILGVQTRAYPSMVQSLRDEPIVCSGSTIAEGIAVSSPGRLTVPIVREHVSEVLLVGEDEIESAVRLLLEVEKSIVEGAGAVGLAALLTHPERFRGRRVGLVLCGGNIDLLVLSSVIQRGLVRESRLARLTVELRDVPGALAQISRIIGDAAANIVEVHHQRAFTTAALTQAEVLFVVETRGERHLQKIVTALHEAGFPTHA